MLPRFTSRATPLSRSTAQALTLLAAVALLTHAASAQTWQTVDAYQYLPG